MMTLRRAFAGVLSAGLVFGLAACGPKTTKTTDTPTSSTPSASASQDSSKPSSSASNTESAPSSQPGADAKAPADAKDNPDIALKIGIFSSPSGVDDGNFNQDVYQGILNFIAKHPKSTVKDIKEPTGDVAAAVQAVTDVVADYDVLVCSGFQFAGIGQLAKDNSDKQFVLIDAYPTINGEEVELPNVYAVQFAEQEGGFFAGVAAALETKSNKVAVVNGIAFPSNVNYQYGFMSGVKYINETQNKKVEVVELPSYAGTDVTNKNVGGNYVGNFNDEAGGKTVGQALLAEGCDILFVAAGGSGNGVYTAVKEAGNAYVIGCDADQWAFGQNGDKNIVLTTAIKNLHLATEDALNKVANGTFKGANALLHADGNFTGYVSEAGHQQLSESTLKTLEEAFKLVANNSIVPAANFNGVTPDTFKAK